MLPLRVFISYTSLDKKLAGELKSYLAQYGIRVFLAHDTINPTDEWQVKILEALEKMDVFIPLLTKEFKLSDWTD